MLRIALAIILSNGRTSNPPVHRSPRSEMNGSERAGFQVLSVGFVAVELQVIV
jgi:hypothetical protein